MSIKGWQDTEKGVEVKPTFGNMCKICYHGLLAKSGADNVFLHYGFGSPESWQDSQTMKMERSPIGWEKDIDLKENIVNFCFKDSANNWDNNSGYNWIARTW